MTLIIHSYHTNTGNSNKMNDKKKHMAKNMKKRTHDPKSKQTHPLHHQNDAAAAVATTLGERKVVATTNNNRTDLDVKKIEANKSKKRHRIEGKNHEYAPMNGKQTKEGMSHGQNKKPKQEQQMTMNAIKGNIQRSVLNDQSTSVTLSKNAISTTTIKNEGTTSIDDAIAHCLKSKNRKFLMSSDGIIYDQIQREHYSRLAHVPASNFFIGGNNSQSTTFHNRTKIALENLYDYYHYDIVMAGGKNLSRTFVKRCLIGEPGITYKYLGLRLFAHAWSGLCCSPMFQAIHLLNNHMIDITKREKSKLQLATGAALIDDKSNSNCQYNLTLINYMEPSSQLQDLKDDNLYGMGKVSVSWHADSSLQKNTCIGVYHTLPTKHNSARHQQEWDWKIALRKNLEEAPNKSSSSLPPPPIVVDTEPGDAYFLLNEMNETHQHMVLAGSGCLRISSTHRVAVIETDTFDYISNRIKSARKLFKKEFYTNNNNITLASEWKCSKLMLLQEVITEVEFEWIAQYWIQGCKHDDQNTWWKGAIRALEDAWSSMEQLSYEFYNRVLEVVTSDSKTASPSMPARKVIDKLIQYFTDRNELRKKWDIRRSDKIYKRRISIDCQPVQNRPIFGEKQLPKDLTSAIEKLGDVLNVYHPVPAQMKGNKSPNSMSNESNLGGTSMMTHKKATASPSLAKKQSNTFTQISPPPFNRTKKKGELQRIATNVRPEQSVPPLSNNSRKRQKHKAAQKKGMK